MGLHLITGYAGEEHITSADQGAYNIATFGDGNFVLDRGQKFKATVQSNNSITIADGEAMLQGRFIKMPLGLTENVDIENGTQGRYRNDLICIRYEKSSVDAVESASLIVLKGNETTGTPADPQYATGKITDGDASVADFPLYRVKLNGINIDSVTQLFDVKVSMTKYMNDYQMPTAGKGQKGAVKIGDGINVTADGTISVPSVSSTGSVTSGSTALVTSGGVYNALKNGSVSKVGTATVGSSKQPVYFNGGTPTACKTLKSKVVNMGSVNQSVGVNSCVKVSFSKASVASKLGVNQEDLVALVGASAWDGTVIISGDETFSASGYMTASDFVVYITNHYGSTSNIYEVMLAVEYYE